MKKHIPYNVKVKFQRAKRWLNDLSTKQINHFAKPRRTAIDFKNYLEISQELKVNKNNVEKVNNMELAAKKIHDYLILPGEIFSYWRAIGNPSKKRGFTESRSLINGELQPTVGGGLCQLSGLLYHLCLKANLEIIERHAHSVDIYTEESRYTPLGSDATVVYGYKDFRVRNSSSNPIQFKIEFEGSRLIGKILSTTKLVPTKVEFIIESKTNREIVISTQINGKTVECSKYKLPS